MNDLDIISINIWQIVISLLNLVLLFLILKKFLFKPVKEGGGVAKLDFKDVSPYGPDNPLLIGSLKIFPVPLKHGSLDTTGWLFTSCGGDGKAGSIAYLTDCNAVPGSSCAASFHPLLF